MSYIQLQIFIEHFQFISEFLGIVRACFFKFQWVHLQQMNPSSVERRWQVHVWKYSMKLQTMKPVLTSTCLSTPNCWPLINCEVHGKMLNLRRLFRCCSMYKRTVASEAVKAERRSCDSRISKVHFCLNSCCFQGDLRVSHRPCMLCENWQVPYCFLPRCRQDFCTDEFT